MAFGDGESFVAAVVGEREAFVVEADEVQDGGVDIVQVDFVFDGVEADLYRFELELVNDGGDWRIIGADYRRALGE